MIHSTLHNLLDPVFCVLDFALQARLTWIRDVGVGHGMATYLEAVGVRFTDLAWSHEFGGADPTSCHIEGGAQSKFTQHWSGRNRICLAAVVEGDAKGPLRWLTKSFADTQAAKAGLPDPFHLAAEGFEWQDVAHLAGIGLAQRAASQFQFVIHQENDARMSHDHCPDSFLSSSSDRHGARLV